MRGAFVLALALVASVVSVRAAPVSAQEPIVPDDLWGTFVRSSAGFFVCLETDLSPAGSPDCYVGYVVPEGSEHAGSLHLVGSGFQKTSSFTVLEESYADAAALRIDGTTAAVDVTFAELGHLVLTMEGEPVPNIGWASHSCLRTVLHYGLASGEPVVFPVARLSGRMSRGNVSEEVRPYAASDGAPSCYAFFAGPSSGAWRLQRHHSAAKRRFPLVAARPPWGRSEEATEAAPPILPPAPVRASRRGRATSTGPPDGRWRPRDVLVRQMPAPQDRSGSRRRTHPIGHDSVPARQW